jgi:hypothetical protein
MKKSMFPREFVEWIGIMSDEIFWNTHTNIWQWHTISKTSENITQYNTSELYYYWLTEIKSKS